MVEVDEIGGDHWRQPNGLLAAGQGVAELGRRIEGRGAGRDDRRVREMIGGDLQQLGGIPQAMNLVEDEPPATPLGKEALRVVHQAAGPRQLAVEVFDVVEAAAEPGLAGAPDPCEPQDRTSLPGTLDSLNPFLPSHHMQFG